jgi:DNA modification methylase
VELRVNPYLQDADLTLYQGDALEVLRTLPDESVHMCATSPPFYGLRDYGTGRWEGGDSKCDHVQKPTRGDAGRCSDDVRPGVNPAPVDTPMRFRDVCGKCGASRVDQQIGLEATPEEWCAKLVDVFREVRRVLRGDGTCWVEVGDSYASGAATGFRPGSGRADGIVDDRGIRNRNGTDAPNCKPKDLIGAPWMLAFALRADGWYLRSDIVWSRPNPMPESVTDRPTKSHSYVFLLSRSARYFFDQEAVREEPAGEFLSTGVRNPRFGRPGGQMPSQIRGDVKVNQYEQNARTMGGDPERYGNGRNVRSVWQIATEAYPDAHFATYPQELVRRCILAGSSERGCCPECGAPWERELEGGEGTYADRKALGYDQAGNVRPGEFGGNQGVVHPPGFTHDLTPKARATKGWRPTCDCGDEQAPIGQVGTVAPDPTPCTVLDPFAGSGTTGLVARKHGRRSILIELSADYCELVARRTQQLSLVEVPGG